MTILGKDNFMLNSDNPLINALREQLQLDSKTLYELQTFDPGKITSPLEMKDAKLWIDVLHSRKGSTIGIIPDYDADGVLSGSLLYAALYELGFDDVTLYPPRIDTGYGMSKQSVEELMELNPNIQTIITTDNGIAAFEGIAYAKSLGLSVLVSDHHLGSEEEPVFDVAVNPNRHNDPSTFKGGAGTVVIWKLMTLYAATYAPEKTSAIYNLFPLAGLSIVADVMPMEAENRTIVHMTVQAFQNKVLMYQAGVGHHPKYRRIFEGLVELWELFEEKGNLKYGIDEGLFGFTLVPMLNSPRRMIGSSRLGFEMFIDFDDSPAPEETAKSLLELNQKRKDTINAISTDVIAKLAQRYENHTPASIVVAVDAKPGIAGLISSKITDRFGVPSLVFATEFFGGTGELMTQERLIESGHEAMSASARSPEGFNIKTALDAVNESVPNILLSYGGHAGAAGARIKCSGFDTFVQTTEAIFGQIAAEIDFNPEEKQRRAIGTSFLFTEPGHYSRSQYQFSQSEVTVDQLIELTKFVKGLKPFGQGFKEPTFTVAINPETTELKPLGKAKKGIEPKHAKVQLDKMSVIFWNVSDEIKRHFEDVDKTIYVTGNFNINSFNGIDSIQLIANKVVAS